jgi:hypothetical protein
VAVTTFRSRLTQVSLVLLVPPLASCATNFGAQTDQVYIQARGVNDRSGQVDVLNAVVVSEASGSGVVDATLVNNDTTEADELTGVTVGGAEAKIAKAGKAAEIAPGGHNNLGLTGAVTAQSAGIVPGSFVEVTFTFQHGQAVTLSVPVVPNNNEYADDPMPSAS